MTKTVYLVRHGQSAANAGIATTCNCTIPLTELGKAQAQWLASHLPKPDLICASDMTRAIETSIPTREKWPTIPFKILREVREFDYLDLGGRVLIP